PARRTGARDRRGRPRFAGPPGSRRSVLRGRRHDRGQDRRGVEAGVRRGRVPGPPRDDHSLLAPPGGVSVRGRGRGAAGRPHRVHGNPRRADGRVRPLRPDLPGPAPRGRGTNQRSSSMNGVALTRPGGPAGTRSLAANLASLLAPWRARAAAVALFVLAAASFELAPPFIVRVIVDDHLVIGRSTGLLLLAVLFLAASGAVQAMTFLYNYLAATIAQGVLSDLRVRLFAHFQRMPINRLDRMEVGDIVSRCTADVETLDVVFSSGIAVLIANLVRLLTLTIGMLVLSPALTLVAALVAPPLVIALRFLQVRVRQAERATRIAVAALTARLQEGLRGLEVVRAFGRESEAVDGFRQVLGSALGASNLATRYSALYTPVTAILAALAVAALLWVGTRETFAAFGISLGTLTAFLILLQRAFQPITALGEEWQTVQAA